MSQRLKNWNKKLIDKKLIDVVASPPPPPPHPSKIGNYIDQFFIFCFRNFNDLLYQGDAISVKELDTFDI